MLARLHPVSVGIASYFVSSDQTAITGTVLMHSCQAKLGYDTAQLTGAFLLQLLAAVGAIQPTSTCRPRVLG